MSQMRLYRAVSGHSVQDSFYKSRNSRFSNASIIITWTKLVLQQKQNYEAFNALYSAARVHDARSADVNSNH